MIAETVLLGGTEGTEVTGQDQYGGTPTRSCQGGLPQAEVSSWIFPQKTQKPPCPRASALILPVPSVSSFSPAELDETRLFRLDLRTP